MSQSASDMISDLFSNPEMMQTIMEMMSAFQGGQTDTNAEIPDLSALADNMDLIMKIKSAIEIMNSNQDDPRLNLLFAIKPYLSKKRLNNVDKAVNIMKISKLTGLLDTLK